uniref:Uncharacterized protein n=1 Tax=Ralstonia solanacearum TaxID=305 RepID=A0A0S4U1Y1_RALSL|nr:protein of unknown function [Ralstonia solanacearum]
MAFAAITPGKPRGTIKRESLQVNRLARAPASYPRRPRRIGQPATVDRGSGDLIATRLT